MSKLLQSAERVKWPLPTAATQPAPEGVDPLEVGCADDLGGVKIRAYLYGRVFRLKSRFGGTLIYIHNVNPEHALEGK